MAGNEILRPDLCIIGGGTAGSALAIAAAGLGLTCTLVEKRLPLGRSQARDLAGDCLTSVHPGLDLAGLRQHIGRAIARMAPNHSAERLRAMGVTVIEGTGHFVDARTVEAGSFRIEAHRFVIATGARRRLEKRTGLELVRPHTPETVLDLDARPERIAILGDAPEALEFAQGFARLGCRVTIVGSVPALDGDYGPVLSAALVRDGIERRVAPIERIEPHRTGAIIHMTDRLGAIAASHLIVADGLVPFTEGLGLMDAGIERTDKALTLRGDLRTTNAKVFAIGDVIGGDLAGQAGIAAQISLVLRAGFFRQPVRVKPEQAVRLLRTDPPLAEAGLTEAEARRTTRGLRIYRASLAENSRAAALGVDEGYIKVMAAPTGRILGAGIIGVQAAELIAPWSLAIAHNLSLDAMAAAPMVQPSLSEIGRQAALGHVVGRLRGPWAKRIMRLVKRLG